MICEECLSLLDEYVEDGLGESQAVEVSAHINLCSSCAEYYEELKHEQEVYALYFMSAEASPALWAGVQAGVEEIQRNRISAYQRFRQRLASAFGISSFNPVYVAASLALLVTLGVIVGVMKYQSGANDSQPEIAARNKEAPRIEDLPETRRTPEDTKITDIESDTVKPARGMATDPTEKGSKKYIQRPRAFKRTTQKNSSSIANRKLTTEEVVEKAERQYKNAIAILSSEIKLRRPLLAPDLIWQLDQSLVEIDRTIIETKRAARAQPNDVVAVQYMTTAYAKKVELLRMIAGN